MNAESVKARLKNLVLYRGLSMEEIYTYWQEIDHGHNRK